MLPDNHYDDPSISEIENPPTKVPSEIVPDIRNSHKLQKIIQILPFMIVKMKKKRKDARNMQKAE